MKFDTYILVARVAPAVLTGIPIYVLYYFLVSPQLVQFFESLLSLKIVSDVTVAAAVLLLALQLNRHLSRHLYERRLFKDGHHLPTTCYLMHADGFFSPEVKARMHNKILSDFGIAIPDARAEVEDERRSRQTIVECVSQIRLHVGKGTLTSQHNTEYGFVRNLVGGSVLGAAVSALSTGIFLWIHPDPVAMYLSAALFAFYALVLLFGDHLVRAYGDTYCRVLLREYLAS